MSATVLFHGFRVPLLGLPESETLQRCEACGRAFALMKARPDLVRKVEFDLRSIKEELERGLKLPGVEARQVLKSGVRVGRETVINV